MTDFSVFVAFFAGLVSFLSPCVLPVMPGFLAYLAGGTVAAAADKRKEIFTNSIFFVLGFTAVFSLLGVLLNTILESVAYDAQIWLARIGGTLIIFFGLYLVGLLKIPAFEREYKFKVLGNFQSRWVTSFLFGSAFAAGWTPCVGAVLGGILGLAATQPGSAFFLLVAYSLGLGLPFLLLGLFTGQAVSAIQRFSPWLPYVNRAFGVLLIIIGVLAFTQNLGLIASFEVLNQFFLQ